MPANVVKTPAQEKMWNKAKEAEAKSYPDAKKPKWAVVNAIFQKMKASKKA